MEYNRLASCLDCGGKTTRQGETRLTRLNSALLSTWLRDREQGPPLDYCTLQYPGPAGSGFLS